MPYPYAAVFKYRILGPYRILYGRVRLVAAWAAFRRVHRRFVTYVGERVESKCPHFALKDTFLQVLEMPYTVCLPYTECTYGYKTSVSALHRACMVPNEQTHRIRRSVYRIFCRTSTSTLPAAPLAACWY
jgi:hypothetical protein